MPDLDFQVERAEPLPYAAVPHLVFKLRISEAGGGVTPIRSLALRCQIRIEPARRWYQPQEKERLVDLFGEPERWSRTLHTMLWANTVVMVPAFTGTTVVDVPVPCTFDFNVAATKYFHGLEGGEVPLCLLMSGTIFYESAEGTLQIDQISWEKETNFRLPVQVWRDMMQMYYPNTAWLALRQDVFDRLSRYKSQNGLSSWEHVFEQLLAAREEAAQP